MQQPQTESFKARNARKGYAPGTGKLKMGYMNNDEIMAGVDSPHIIKVERTTHNEVTMTTKKGLTICRLRETNIAWVNDHGEFGLNTGGWNTIITRRHMQDFLKRQNFDVQIRGDKKAGGIRLGGLKGGDIIFKQRVDVLRSRTLVDHEVD